MNTSQNKFFDSASYENHTVTFIDKKRGKTDIYDYPDTVATDEFDNPKLFEEIVAKRLPLFLDGFSCNYVAYGQTGSGKSHTIIGPHGVFKNNQGLDIDNPLPELGLFPRAAMHILKEIQGRSQKSVMTISASESPYRDPVDLTTKQMISLDL